MKKETMDKAIVKAKNFELNGFEKKKRIIIDAVIILIGIVWIVIMINLFSSKNSDYTSTFYKCVDGDTVKLTVNYKIETVNLLNITSSNDTYTCDTIKKAKEIKVELESGIDKYDKNGNMNAWVYVDGKLLQKILIEKGYATLDDKNYSKTKDLKNIN